MIAVYGPIDFERALHRSRKMADLRSFRQERQKRGLIIECIHSGREKVLEKLTRRSLRGPRLLPSFLDYHELVCFADGNGLS